MHDARGAFSSLLIQLATRSDTCCKSFPALYSAHDAGSQQPGEWYSVARADRGRTLKLHQVIHKPRYEGAEVEKGG